MDEHKKIIDFVEKSIGTELSEWQKDYLCTCYDAKKEGKDVFVCPPRHANRRSFDILTAICIMILAKKDGILGTDVNFDEF